MNSTQATIGTLNFSNLYQNGVVYIPSQWTGTIGSTVSYTSGNVSTTNFIATNNTLSNIISTNIISTNNTLSNIVSSNIISTSLTNSNSLLTNTTITGLLASSASVGTLYTNNCQIGTGSSYLINLGTSGVGTSRSGYFYGDGTSASLLNQQSGSFSIGTGNTAGQILINSSGTVNITNAIITNISTSNITYSSNPISVYPLQITSTGSTLTATQVIGTTLVRNNTNGGTVSDTLPLASTLVSAISNCTLGSTFNFNVTCNLNGGATYYLNTNTGGSGASLSITGNPTRGNFVCQVIIMSISPASYLFNYLIQN